MNEPSPTLWAGVCAGGYFAAAAVHLGNVLVLGAFRAGSLSLTLIMGGFPVVCSLMGGLLLAGKRWAPRWGLWWPSGFPPSILSDWPISSCSLPLRFPLLLSLCSGNRESPFSCFG